MENIRNRLNFNLVHTKKRLQKLVSKPSFESFTIFNKDLVGVKNKKVKLLLNKPIYTGMSILDLSKLFMYEFHYGFIKTQYGGNAKLLMTDTDSLFYRYVLLGLIGAFCYLFRVNIVLYILFYFLFCRFEVEDMYKEMSKHIDLFDTSNYPRDHFLFSEINKKVVGKMKDETASQPVMGFVGLRPKMYSFIVYNEEKTQVKKAKGITKSVVNKELAYQNYVDCLLNCKLERHTMNSIRSENHNLFLKAINKISLSSFDDKRWWLKPNGIEGYSY